ncbi:hypothetical protein DBR32_00700 [Taibaiella sp. KBW10]|uniref:methyltransferase domain-containing protein n=1 Tax=Taibaiella sp. KBW10 TaxID=2153357 RepID=UPI000F5962D0|nr:methyltransferase domain-containing protein [Taibaiella sp. KBW10]RQO32166.1 hypothetical protein DBR32_00700 [Taibaiella sp. KBW10]
MYFIKQAIEEIIIPYDGTVPLTHFLKQYFKAHPKLGSRDRRAISDAVYTYYRVARFYPAAQYTLWDIIQHGLSSGKLQNPFLEKALAASATQTIAQVSEKPFEALAFSEGMDAAVWHASIATQPLLFIRMRKHIPGIIQRLQEQAIVFQQLGNQALSITNGAQIDKILKPSDYVVQDWSSQRSLDLFLQTAVPDKQKELRVWDTCSGAGGKILLLKDLLPEAAILSTDIRESILHNLKERARLYGHKKIATKIVDSSSALEVSQMMDTDFDLVLCDVPCSGSGTWARTPEQFHFFDPKRLADFAALQFSIADNACTKVKPGGYFLYITCSVFAAENEAVVTKLLAHHPELSLIQSQLRNGIEDRADSMFVALFRKAS